MNAAVMEGMGMPCMENMRRDDLLMDGRAGAGMMDKHKRKEFLEYANEAAVKIREIYHIFGGYGEESSPEGGLLGNVYDCIAEMISLYLAPITGKEINSDELNDVTCEIMRMDKEGIGDFIKKYCNPSI